MTLRLLLADDHRMFRDALRIQLLAEPGIEIVATTGNARETLQAAAATRPDVAVLDIALPDMNGIDAARALLAQQPQLRIVALSGYGDRMYVEEMLKAGARAYVLKSAGVDELIRAIHAAVAGHVFLSPEITAGMLRRDASQVPVSVLSKRELDVLRLLASGLRSAEIAAQLGIAVTTVEVHRRNIKQKLGLRTVAELTRYAIREGLHTA